jgi:hypothetical protein
MAKARKDAKLNKGAIMQGLTAMRFMVLKINSTMYFQMQT